MTESQTQDECLSSFACAQSSSSTWLGLLLLLTVLVFDQPRELCGLHMRCAMAMPDSCRIRMHQKMPARSPNPRGLFMTTDIVINSSCLSIKQNQTRHGVHLFHIYVCVCRGVAVVVVVVGRGVTIKHAQTFVDHRTYTKYIGLWRPRRFSVWWSPPERKRVSRNTLNCICRSCMYVKVG